MKSSLLVDFDDLESSMDPIKEIKQFIKDNYKIDGELQISNEPNENGKYEVSVSCIDASATARVDVKNMDIISLTNGLFKWKYIAGSFTCYNCYDLTSLEGAPKKVSGNFNCSWCTSLTSLEGAPEEVGRDFYCMDCSCLTSVDGITEKIGRNCMFTGCRSIKITKNTPINIIEKIARYIEIERTE